MKADLIREFAEVTDKYDGLTRLVEGKTEVVLSGNLVFEADAPGLPLISESFEVELSIPPDYPQHLPSVREIAGKLDPKFEHLYPNGQFCLAVPVEERRLFNAMPSMLGFVDNLVIPYLYSYCHHLQYGTYPFGDRSHGYAGIVNHYQDMLGIVDEFKILALLVGLLNHGYHGHHSCACGSGKAVRRCHGEHIQLLMHTHTKETLRADFEWLALKCLDSTKAGGRSFPETLRRQVVRILNLSRYAPVETNSSSSP